jgi:hypothetical protein
VASGPADDPSLGGQVARQILDGQGGRALLEGT